MKRSLLVLGAVTSLTWGLSTPVVAQGLTARAWKPEQLWDSTMLRRVNLSLENARTSDQLLALSKASELSIFADATLFSATSTPVSLDTDNLVRTWIMETASQEGLSWRRSDGRTWLFWKEPDAPAVVKSLIAEVKARTPLPDAAQAAEAGRNVPPAFAPSLESRSREAGLFLADYLQQQRGWDGQSPLQGEFKLSELEPQAAAELLSIARAYPIRFQQMNQSRWMKDADWLSDETWKSARLLYSKSPGRPAPILAVTHIQGDIQSFLGIEDIRIPSLPVTGVPENIPISIAPPANEAFTALNADELSRDVALARPVALEVKEVSLGDLLLEIQKQGGVTLKMAPGLLPDRRVTVRTPALPLHQSMKALSELYGTSWAKAPDGSYLMQSGFSPVFARALQIGDPDWFGYWRGDSVRNIVTERWTMLPHVDWQSELLKANVEEAALRAPDGVAIAALPTGLKGLIRRVVEEKSAVDLMRQYGDAFASSAVLREGHEAEVTVRVSPVVPKAAPAGGAVPRRATLAILKVDLVEGGKAVHSFGVYGPQARKGIEEALRREREMQDRMQQIPAQQPTTQ